MDFIGRKKELEMLESEYSGNGSLTIIYGRRRVGKTALIRRFMESKDGIYFLATQQNAKDNLKSFSELVGIACGEEGISFSSWVSAMEYAVRHGKRIIAIDEFQYLAESDRSVTSLFQHAWDTKLRDMGAMLILCGSYIGMMEKYTLNQSSPLYGRRTCTIRLEPLSFFEVLRSRKWSDNRSAIEYYGITGGVPKYMEIIDPGDIRGSISKAILDRQGVLFEEPMFLLRGEMKEPANYISILTAISKGNTKLDKISGAMEIKSNSLSPYLESMTSMGILERRIPVTDETGRSRNGRFIIKDCFLRFWFRFVFPYMTSLQQDLKREPTRDLDEHLDDSFMSFVFEDICRAYVREGILGEFDRVGSYWNSKTEIGVVALDMVDGNALAGECKYSTQPVPYSVLNGLKEKCRTIPELDGFKIRYVLFSMSGFSDDLVSNKPDDTDLVDMRSIV